MSQDNSLIENKSVKSEKSSKSSLLAKSKSSTQQWPNLRDFSESSSSSTEQTYDIGLGDENLIHCIQISRYLQQRSLESESTSHTVAPILTRLDAPQSLVVKDLTLESVQELLKRAIVLLCVHCGYDITSSSVLQVLVDVSAAFIERMCQITKMAIDTSTLRENDDFAIEISQILESVGFSLENLRDYVNSIALKKQKLLLESKTKYGVILLDSSVPQNLQNEPAEPLDLLVGLEVETTNDEVSCNEDWRRQLGVICTKFVSLF